MNYRRGQMKRNAKAAMAAANPRPWLVTLVFLLLLGAVPGAVNALVPNPLMEYAAELVTAALENGRFDALPPRSYEALLRVGLRSLGLTAAFSFGVAVLLAVFLALMHYGYRGYSLEVYRREPHAGVGSLFKGFPRFGGAVGSALLVWMFSVLWGLLIYGVAAVVVGLIFYFTLWSGTVWLWLVMVALFFLAGLIHTLVTYRYCLTPYFIMDNKKMPSSQAVTASVVTMRGKIAKRLMLDVSFWGWELLRKLIAAAVTALAAAVALVAVRGSVITLVDLSRRGLWLLYYRSEAMEQAAAALLTLAVALVVVFTLAFLAQLPLKLWLMSYKNVALAGFYQELAVKKEEAAVPAAAAVSGSAYFSNAQPATPAVSPAEEDLPGTAPTAETAEAPRQEEPEAEKEEESLPAQPETPVYTPFGGSSDAVPPAPEAPVPPAAPEVPAAPEAPEAPEEPEN